MQQKRLYYNNSYLKNFDALVAGKYTDGDKRGLILDKTAFYPSSGGQPCDFGTIAGISVTDVFEREDGEIVHLLEKDPHIEEGLPVKGIVDWNRRFLHMQQHTGQHILSGAFLEKFSIQTVSFHMGKDFSTIDLETSGLTQEEIIGAENLANRIVFENRDINTLFMDKKEAEARLRKNTVHDGINRIIDIKDFDFSACGGTHCKFTGEVGLILVGGWEKIKGNLRIEFYCGQRALNLFREYNSILKEVASRFSVGHKDLISKMDKLVSENKNNFKNLKSLKEKYAEQEIELIYRKAETVNNKFKYIKGIYDDKSVKDLKFLAKKLLDSYNSIIICFATSKEPSNLLLARSKDIDINLAEYMKSCDGTFSGRGGGRPDFFQGGGYKLKDIEEILTKFQKETL